MFQRGKAGKGGRVSPVKGWHGEVRRVFTRYGRQGVIGFDSVSCGKSWLVEAGKVCRGKVRYGLVWQGAVWLGRVQRGRHGGAG